MDPIEAAESVTEDQPKNRLNTMVAASVALLATFMAVCNVKDGNIMQAMQMAQADRIDNWAWYQAKKNRLEMMTIERDRLELEGGSGPSSRNPYWIKAAAYDKEISEKTKELRDVQDKAKAAEKAYDDWNAHDDQFDLSESSITVAISLLAVTALTNRRWLFWLAMVPAAVGVVMGIAGFAGWNLRIEALMKFLGT